MLIFGAILFFVGAFLPNRFFIAAGMILIVMSFFGRIVGRSAKKVSVDKEHAEKKQPQKKSLSKTKMKCSDCGAEVLPEDNYCPECGKKVLP